ncbi:hypothetical protein, partial [Klebsiella pneumoniae]|uniref:hypothetical protein n=1 Tax=Klebsiella pneumoniae TaxID=573 RepID=UPI00396A91EB
MVLDTVATLFLPELHNVPLILVALLLGAGLGVVGQLGFHRGDFLGQGQQVADAHVLAPLVLLQGLVLALQALALLAGVGDRLGQ